MKNSEKYTFKNSMGAIKAVAPTVSLNLEEQIYIDQLLVYERELKTEFAPLQAKVDSCKSKIDTVNKSIEGIKHIHYEPNLNVDERIRLKRQYLEIITSSRDESTEECLKLKIKLGYAGGQEIEKWVSERTKTINEYKATLKELTNYRSRYSILNIKLTTVHRLLSHPQQLEPYTNIYEEERKRKEEERRRKEEEERRRREEEIRRLREEKERKERERKIRQAELLQYRHQLNEELEPLEYAEKQDLSVIEDAKKKLKVLLEACKAPELPVESRIKLKKQYLSLLAKGKDDTDAEVADIRFKLGYGINKDANDAYERVKSYIEQLQTEYDKNESRRKRIALLNNELRKVQVWSTTRLNEPIVNIYAEEALRKQKREQALNRHITESRNKWRNSFKSRKNPVLQTNESEDYIYEPTQLDAPIVSKPSKKRSYSLKAKEEIVIERNVHSSVVFKGVRCFNSDLRSYQIEAKSKIFRLWENPNIDSVMLQMPTGTGKTRLFTSVIKDIQYWGQQTDNEPRILVIAHRKELIAQIDESLDKYNIPHGVIKSDYKDKYGYSKRFPDRNVQISSVQTMTNWYNEWESQHMYFDFVIVDEAHHTKADTYKLLWKWYPNAKRLGVTATPWRMNNEGFTDLFDKLVESWSVKEFIRKGFLAQFKYYSINMYGSIQNAVNSIKLNKFNDYAVSDMMDAMDRDGIRAQLIDSYKKYAWGKKGIIYSISQEHSRHICREFRNVPRYPNSPSYETLRVDYIDSKTPAKRRERLVQSFKDGYIDILVNVNIFSEGFDCPDIEFIQLARPTHSLVMYLQQVGRGLRPHKDKDACVILDNVGMYTRFGLPDREWPWQDFFVGKDVNMNKFSQQKDPIEQIKYWGRNGKKDFTEGNEDMVLVQDVDYDLIDTKFELGEEYDNDEVSGEKTIEELLVFLLGDHRMQIKDMSINDYRNFMQNKGLDKADLSLKVQSISVDCKDFVETTFHHYSIKNVSFNTSLLNKTLDYEFDLSNNETNVSNIEINNLLSQIVEELKALNLECELKNDGNINHHDFIFSSDGIYKITISIKENRILLIDFEMNANMNYSLSNSLNVKSYEQMETKAQVSEYFPIYGITLGASVENKNGNYFEINIPEDNEKFSFDVNGMEFYGEQQNNRIMACYLPRNYNIPDMWVGKGFNWILTLKEWEHLFKEYGFIVQLHEQKNDNDVDFDKSIILIASAYDWAITFYLEFVQEKEDEKVVYELLGIYTEL